MLHYSWFQVFSLWTYLFLPGVTDTFDSEDLSADNPSTTTDTFTGKDLTPKTPSTPTRQAVTDGNIYKIYGSLE